jgi:hypothetical protein
MAGFFVSPPDGGFSFRPPDGGLFHFARRQAGFSLRA